MKHKIGIEKKLLFWLCTCSIVVMVLLGGIIGGVLRGGEEKHIVQYMTEQMEYFNTAVRQKLYFEEYPVTPESFEMIADASAEEYMNLFDDQVNCYTVFGDRLYATYEDNIGRERTDVDFAMEGKNSYTVVEQKDATTVYGSLRVVVDGEFIGIMRLRRDYTDTYQNMKRTWTELLLIAGGIMITATVILAIFMHRFTSPIRRLSEEISRNAETPEKIEVLSVKSKDEVGELTEAYNRMAETIRMQLHQLEAEKETIRRTMEYQKSFYDNLTHELKTPVTIILGYAEMMEQTNLEDRAFAEKGVSEIICEGKRLREMVSGLLTESRSMSDGRRHERLDLGGLVEEVSSSMGIKARKYGTEIDTEVCSATVLGEEQRLRQLFVNLLDNAIKYSAGGEPIRIRMTETAEAVTVSLQNEAQTDALGDTKRIFMPFYRARRIADRESGSVGLGLSICMNIAQEHGAMLSAAQNGTTVEFRVSFRKQEKEGDR